jgi:hypothetical protein
MVVVFGDLVALSETGSGGGGCTLGGDSSEEENKEDEMEKSRLSSRLHAAQQFRGSQVLTARGRSNTGGWRSLGIGGGGGISVIGSSGSAEETSGTNADQERGRVEGGGAEKDEEDGSDWKEIMDAASGKPYYYNSKTNETTWENPLGDIAL